MAGKEAKLCEFIVRGAIVAELQATDRNGVIRELVESLARAGAVPKGLVDELINEIAKREMKGSTGFGKGVAVPHTKHADLKKMVGVIGRSSAGVDFASLDKQPVHSFVLLISPISDPAPHLAAMSTIFGNLQNDMFRKFLRQATTADQIWDLLQEADQNARV